jgi:hypothetical protein
MRQSHRRIVRLDGEPVFDAQMAERTAHAHDSVACECLQDFTGAAFILVPL